MTDRQTHSSRTARRAGKQGARTEVLVLASELDKYKTEPKETPLLKCKRVTRISTFNVRTISPKKQSYELIASALRYNIDVICVQEHRFYHPDHELKYHKFEKGWTFVSTTAWKNARNSTIGGVDILLSPFALKSLNKIEKISPRISIATFHGNPCTTVIACYCPHNERPEEEVQEFYDTLWTRFFWVDKIF